MGGPIVRVLIAEDDAASRLTLESWFRRWNYEVVSCRDGSEAWQQLSGIDAPPLIVLDWMMPGVDGVELCKRIRARTDVPYAYVIMVSGRARRVDIVDGLEAGADDYVTKPIDLHELQARVRTARRILDLHAALYAAGEELRIQATRDPLTGLLNHGESLVVLSRELERGQRESRPTAVIMADVDHFKEINDLHGHAVGDIVLKETASRLAGALRPYDSIGRYGGEEFLIVLSGAAGDTAFQLGERLRQCIAERPVPVADAQIGITISVGVATQQLSQPIDAGLLIRAADAALYRAKRGGRNRTEIASTERELQSP